MKARSIHVHSMRIAEGREVLVARVVAEDGSIGFGFSFRLEATEARHMAEWAAGVRKEPPNYQPSCAHPWEIAWASGKNIEWDSEPAFAALGWPPTA